MAAKGGKKQVIKSPGKPPISFKKGGLHKSLGVPEGKPVPPGKMRDALAGKNGPKAKAQAQFARNVLTGPKKTPSKTTRKK
jgi:hypothetical protein